MSKYVVDASAILAFVFQEPGADRVESAASSSRVSTVNLAEAGSVLTKAGYSIDDVQTTLAAAAFEVTMFDELQAIETARLRPLTLRHGLGLGDRACLALARLQELPVLTADRAWASLDIGVEVILIR